MTHVELVALARAYVRNGVLPPHGLSAVDKRAWRGYIDDVRIGWYSDRELDARAARRDYSSRLQLRDAINAFHRDQRGELADE